MATRGEGSPKRATQKPPGAGKRAAAVAGLPEPTAAGYAPVLKAGFHATTDSVQEMHAAIAGETFDALLRVPGLSVPTRIAQGVHDAITQGVYTAVRHGGGAALSMAAGPDRLTADSGRVPGFDASSLRSALNGAFGDALEASSNPLAIRMGLHAHGLPVALTPASLASLRERVLVFIHGLACDERSWEGRAPAWDASPWAALSAPGASFEYGTLLERELPVSALYLRYNTGQAIDTNARAFAEMLEQLLGAAPQVREIVLIGHSMGGLVARRAHDTATAAGLAWPRRTPMLICIGSPHQGAPLEQLGLLSAAASSMSDATRPLARPANARRTGSQGLRQGSKGKRATTLEASRRPALKLVFGSLGDEDESALGKLIGQVLGDGLVQPSSASASGVEGDVERCALPGLGHMALLSHPRVYVLLRRWLGAPDAGPSASA